MSIRAVGTTRLRAVAAAALVVGTYLPWFRTNLYTGTPAVYGERLSRGIEGADPLLLGSAAVVFLLCVSVNRERVEALSAAVAGTGAIVVCISALWHWSSHVLFDFWFIPASGWFLTLFAGATLFVSGFSSLRGTNARARIGAHADKER